MYDDDIGTDELVMGLPLLRRFYIGRKVQVVSLVLQGLAVI